MVRSRRKSEEPSNERQSGIGLDVNAVVSYNVKAIRERRGWTQQSVAERLGQVTGHQLPQASISAMERGFDGERRRRFDAHELYLFSVVFDVPIAYFFVPPPGTGFELLADTGRPVSELYASLLGQESQLAPLDDRLAEIQIGNPEESDATLAAIFGAEGASRNWHESFRTWRKNRLAEIERGYGDRLDEVALFLKEFATKIEALGPRGYLQSMAHREGETVLDSDVDEMSTEGILDQVETTRPEE
jgi:transcriptional regulator with XRE-family HTH domain